MIHIFAGQSYAHLKNFRCLQQDSNPWPLRCSAVLFPTDLRIKPLRCEQVTLLGSCVPVKGAQVQQTFLSPIIPFMGTHEPNKLICSNISSFIVQLVKVLHRYCRSHGFESCWRHLKFFRCTCEAIAEIVQQVWGSFLKFMSQPHYTNIIFFQSLLN